MDKAAAPPTRDLGGIQVTGSRVDVVDRAFMGRALELAAQGMGRAHPNPMVGCVIVKDGRIIGEGFHRGAGSPHAEAQAVADAGGPSAVEGSTVYVNLEPCAHHGRTPPCADLLVKCRPAEVVVSHEDPDPRVAGKGLDGLRDAGISVIVGVCLDEAQALNEAWLAWVQYQRPFVALKFAMTLDGKISARGGHSQWITDVTARQHAHVLRNRYDALLVGVGTVLADNPRLTCRIEGGRDPIRVVLDSDARTPPSARLLSEVSTAPTWIFVADDADPKRVSALRQAGAQPWVVPRSNGGLSLGSITSLLADNQVVSVLVEGGPQVHRSFLDNGLCDKLYLFLGAKTVGGDDAPGPIAGQAVNHMASARSWQIRNSYPLAGDVCCEVYPLET